MILDSPPLWNVMLAVLDLDKSERFGFNSHLYNIYSGVLCVCSFEGYDSLAKNQ